MNFLTTTAIVKILEVSSAFYPEKNGIFSPNESFILPSQNTTVQFGGSSDILCGPSPFLNTMNCFSTKYTNFSKSVPIPGELSTTPIFQQDSWIIGTAKGFLIRVTARSKSDSLPTITPQNSELWGSESREIMEDFVPKTIYKESGLSSSSNTEEKISNVQNKKLNRQEQIEKPKNYMWIFPTSSQFVGTPIIKNGFVYALTANQSLQALDFSTGKLIWSVKVAPDVSFYLENQSLVVTDKVVLIGTNRGRLLILDALTGNLIHGQTLGSASDQEDRFPAIVAAPLILENHHFIVSNAVSVTQKISLESYETSWTYPAGSIITPLILNDSTLILTTSNGAIVSIDEHNGSENWSTNLNKNSPLIDTTFTNDKKTLLVATKRGELIALDSATGKILAKNRSIGTVVGYFFQIPKRPNESCLSFSTGSFRCFRVKI